MEMLIPAGRGRGDVSVQYKVLSKWFNIFCLCGYLFFECRRENWLRLSWMVSKNTALLHSVHSVRVRVRVRVRPQ